MHGAGLGGVANKVCDNKGGLRLTEAFHEGQSCVFLELVEYLGVQRLTCDGAVLEGAEVVVLDARLDEEAEHGGRCTEGRDLILGKEGKKIGGVELVKVVGKYAAFAEPLTVQLTPERLTPSCVGDGEMDTIGVGKEGIRSG